MFRNKISAEKAAQRILGLKRVFCRFFHETYETERNIVYIRFIDIGQGERFHLNIKSNRIRAKDKMRRTEINGGENVNEPENDCTIADTSNCGTAINFRHSEREREQKTHL